MSTKQREKAAVRREIRAAMGPQATLKHLRITPRKVRLVLDMIRGKPVEEAINILTFSPKTAAKPVQKLLKSAVANADNKGDVNLDKLVVTDAYANEGPTLRRWLPRAMGRATRIRKRTTHVTVVLGEKA
jgi:large subunit ribosomal protein L22